MSEPKHIILPAAPRSTRGAPTRMVSYQPAPPEPPVPVPAAPYEALSPELRHYLTLSMRTLAYWVSLPDAQVPTLSPADRARDQAVLRGLKQLLS